MSTDLARTTSAAHFRLAVLLVACSLAAHAGDLASTLERLDHAAQGFRGLTASIRNVSHTAIIKDTSEESGTIALFRPKPRDVRMLVRFTEPSPRTVAFAGRKVQVYYPKINTVQEYDLGKQASLIDQFLLLGFGTTSAELRSNYDVKYTGEGEAAGEKCDRLELAPKSAEARKHVTRIEMWLSSATGQPAQLQIFQPSRDYRLMTYTNVKTDPAMTEAAVKMNLPKGVKKEFPQR